MHLFTGTDSICVRTGSDSIVIAEPDSKKEVSVAIHDLEFLITALNTVNKLARAHRSTIAQKEFAQRNGLPALPTETVIQPFPDDAPVMQ
ncbi:hypothetical protein CPPEL_03040 [Corynebacterium pseudopelargi]|uniref:Uncharacterized protein n=1 Tax=Corynebacterium pseudopelargi TaxID=2080757 RepID=A0A3G6ISW8_9CORY|nr:hypothetical protein CPPEL_03040 [Corynebacterium pseudopelargi]